MYLVRGDGDSRLSFSGTRIIGPPDPIPPHPAAVYFFDLLHVGERIFSGKGLDFTGI
jgi:hypothetical protein